MFAAETSKIRSIAVVELDQNVSRSTARGKRKQSCNLNYSNDIPMGKVVRNDVSSNILEAAETRESKAAKQPSESEAEGK